MSGASTIQQDHKRPSPSTTDPQAVGKKQAMYLDWRKDPEESYSDWKIEIIVDGKTHGTYHVHRFILSTGSQYFARLFANTALKEHETHTSRIEMEALAAESFPLMLDYLYFLWNNDEKPVTAENAVSLHHLGSYFEIHGLQEEAQTFWEQSMTIDQAVTYLEHARVFQEDQVYDAVAEEFVGYIHVMEVDSPLMEVSDTKFWVTILNKNNGEPKPALSTLVSSFCSKNKDALDPTVFLQLTDTTGLPRLTVGAAMELLQLEKLFGLTSASSTELSSLQQRTLDALASSSNVDVSLEDVQCWFRDLPPLVLSQAMALLTSKMWDLKDYYNKKIVRNYVPKEIVVSGAGFAVVNGTYVRMSEFGEGSPRFAMAGTRNRRPATYEIHRKASADYPGKYEWVISNLKGTSPSDKDDHLYYVPEEDSPWLPPKIGWVWWSGSRVAPALLLSFHFDKKPPPHFDE